MAEENSLVNWFKKWFFEEIKNPNISFVEPYNEEDIIQIGRDAEELLKNPAFQSAFMRYEKQLLSHWRNSTPLQTDGRESIWHRMEALDEIKITLSGMVKNMVLEKNKIEEERKLKGVTNE